MMNSRGGSTRKSPLVKADLRRPMMRFGTAVYWAG